MYHEHMQNLQFGSAKIGCEPDFCKALLRKSLVVEA